ncbi:MAG: hypothetical protein P4K94_04885 [Terracidiphilus sp.]|nr:hypothetical protein [Terracidiphilus sp.]
MKASSITRRDFARLGAGAVESYSATPGYDNTAAIACHMSNHSYFQHNVAVWDAATKTIKA